MTPDGDWYVDKATGERVPRVTAVLAHWYDPSAAAATWVAQEARRLSVAAIANETVDIVDSVWDGNRFVWAVEKKDPVQLLSDTKYMIGAYWRGKQAAMDRGTLTNDFIDQWASGLRITADDVPDWCDQRFEEGKLMPDAKNPTPWKADRDDLIDHVCVALKWLSETVPTITATQVFLRCSQYAGTADALGAHGGKPRIYEFKTGQVNRSHALQIAGGYCPIAQQQSGVRLVPTLVYFSTERYRELEVTGAYKKWCVDQFNRDLKAWDFRHRETPWNNVKSVKIDKADLPFVR